MKHTFRNEQPKTYELLPEGDYLLEVAKADVEISQGGKTRGAEVLNITWKSVEHGTDFKDKLIFHPSTDWKVDLFVNCFGLATKEGQEVDLDPDSIIGARGWCRVMVDTFKGNDGNERKNNKIAVFYTDREKYSRSAPPVTAGMPAGGDDWD